MTAARMKMGGCKDEDVMATAIRVLLMMPSCSAWVIARAEARVLAQAIQSCVYLRTMKLVVRRSAHDELSFWLCDQ